MDLLYYLCMYLGGSFQPMTPSELIQLVGKYSEGREDSSENDDSDDDDEKHGVSEDSVSEDDVEGETPSDSLSSHSQSQSSLGTENGPGNQVCCGSGVKALTEECLCVSEGEEEGGGQNGGTWVFYLLIVENTVTVNFLSHRFSG